MEDTKANKATFQGALNLVLPERYMQEDRERTRWHEVGVAFVRAPENGDPYIVIRIPPGVSLSGEVQVRTRRQKKGG